MPTSSLPDIFERAQRYVDKKEQDKFVALVQEVMTASPSYNAHQQGTGEYLRIKSAINKKTIDHIKQTTAQEYAALYSAAQTAQAWWKQVPLAGRVEFIQALETALSDAATIDRLVFATSADVGKTTTDAKKENTKALEWLLWAKDRHTLDALKPTGRIHQLPLIAHTLSPVGVVGVITSFNYPLALSMAGIVPALLAGNAVIFKCSSKAPHWAFIFQDAFRAAMRQCGHSQGDALFSVIVGRGNTLAVDVDNLFFVGSSRTGHEFEMQRDAESKRTGTRKHTHVELGGNAAAVVMESAFADAPDAAKKLQAIATSIYEGNSSNSGQRCTKAAVLIAEAGPYGDKVIKALAALYDPQTQKIGNPFDTGNKSGALVDDGALSKMKLLLARARALNAIITGGTEVGANYAPAGGNYVNPALIDWSGVDAQALHDTYLDDAADEKETLYHAITHETFAPVLHIVRRAGGVDEAVELANEYDQEKLAVAVYSDDAQWQQMQHRIHATSKSHNQAPKDLSPWAEHGNWGHRFKSGGKEAFASFTYPHNYQEPDPQAAQAIVAEYTRMFGEL